jgi:hypothetical protein
MRWIRRTGVALLCVGILGYVIALLSPHAAALRTWQSVGALLCAAGYFVFLSVPGALLMVRHPLAATLRQLLGQRFNHPRLIGLARAWEGAWWAIALLLALLWFPSSLYVPMALMLVGSGPLFAVVRFDRRRR